MDIFIDNFICVFLTNYRTPSGNDKTISAGSARIYKYIYWPKALFPKLFDIKEDYIKNF